MNIDLWEFGMRPEVKLTRFVIINGIRFDLRDVLDVLYGLDGADGLLNPIVIHDEALAEELMTEGLCYPNGQGSYGGTDLVPAAIEKLEVLYHADMAEEANPQLKYAFMDSTTFDHELGNTNAETFASPEQVEAAEECARKGECGIVKVVVYATEAVKWPTK